MNPAGQAISRKSKFILLSLTLLGFLVLFGSGKGFAKKSFARFGYSANSLASVDTKDAEIALKVWAQEITRNEGFDLEYESRVYETLPGIRQALKNHEMDVFALSIEEYLDVKNEFPELEPRLTGQVGDSPMEKFLLVARKHPGVSALADLKGKSLIVENRMVGNMPLMWLECRLASEGLPISEKFFSSIQTVTNPSKAILPVFFGKAEGCLVRETALNTVIEMNPQVGQVLQTLEVGFGVPRGVFVFQPKFDPETRDLILRSAGKLSGYPRGKQVLTLFRLDRVVPFLPEFLIPSEVVYQQFKTMKERLRKDP